MFLQKKNFKIIFYRKKLKKKFSMERNLKKCFYRKKFKKKFIHKKMF